MIQTWEKSKKINFGPNFCPFNPNLSQPIFFMSFISDSNNTLLKHIVLGNLQEN